MPPKDVNPGHPTPSPESINFDRAASFYDRTRALSPEASRAIVGQIVAEFSGRGPCLEIGIGTGRVGLPVAAAGVDVVGVDLSARMLARLVENAGGDSPVPLVRADATRLPFAAGSFGAALASWVLHLIGGWQDALKEIDRVVRPRGVLIVDLGGTGRGIHGEMANRFKEEAGITDWPVGASKIAEIDEFMATLGGTPRELDQIVDVREERIEDAIAALRDGVYSVSWHADEETRKEAAHATAAWAERRYGSLTEPRRVEAIFERRAYDLRRA